MSPFCMPCAGYFCVQIRYIKSVNYPCLFTILRFRQDPATRINDNSPRGYVCVPRGHKEYIPRKHLSILVRLARNLPDFKIPKQASINAVVFSTAQRYCFFPVLANKKYVLGTKTAIFLWQGITGHVCGAYGAWNRCRLCTLFVIPVQRYIPQLPQHGSLSLIMWISN